LCAVEGEFDVCVGDGADERGDEDYFWCAVLDGDGGLEEGVRGLEEEEGGDGVYLECFCPFVDGHLQGWTKVIAHSCVGDYEVEVGNVVFGLERVDGGWSIGVD